MPHILSREKKSFWQLFSALLAYNTLINKEELTLTFGRHRGSTPDASRSHEAGGVSAKRGMRIIIIAWVEFRYNCVVAKY